jgi:single-strand DNA-binding protein
MVEDTNITAVVGRLTKDAEIKTTPGIQIGFFTVASNRKKKDSNGKYTEEASFFDVNVYGKYAETIIPNLKKGVQVCVVGNLRQERWQDKKTGQNTSRILITANSIQIFGGKAVNNE